MSILLSANFSQTSSCEYNEMVELRNESGDHFDLFFHKFPNEALTSQEAFQEYKSNNEEEYERIIDNSYHMVRMGFFYDTFDRSYMESIKKELDDVIRCQ